MAKSMSKHGAIHKHRQATNHSLAILVLTSQAGAHGQKYISGQGFKIGRTV